MESPKSPCRAAVLSTATYPQPATPSQPPLRGLSSAVPREMPALNRRLRLHSSCYILRRRLAPPAAMPRAIPRGGISSRDGLGVGNRERSALLAQPARHPALLGSWSQPVTPSQPLPWGLSPTVPREMPVPRRMLRLQCSAATRSCRALTFPLAKAKFNPHGSSSMWVRAFGRKGKTGSRRTRAHAMAARQQARAGVFPLRNRSRQLENSRKPK